MKIRQMGSVALLATAALVLSACSGGGGSASQDQAGSAADGGTLTFANWQWREPGRGELLWAGVSKYEEFNPAAKLKKQEVTRADFEKTMSTQIGAGAGPDLLIIPAPFFATLSAAGALEPLDGVLTDEEKAKMLPGNEEYKSDGKQLALLWEAVPYALIWNKNLLADAGITNPPTTFDELLQDAKAIKDKTGKAGFVGQHMLSEESTWWSSFSNWAYGFGGSWSDGKKLTIDSKVNIDGANAFKEMYNSGAFGVGEDASTYRSKFSQGQIGFIVENASAVKTMVTGDSSLKSADVGSSVLPFPSGSSGATTFAIGINAHSKNKELAKDFLRWQYSKDAQVGAASDHFPAIIGTDAPVPKELVDANPWIEGYYTQFKNSKSLVIEGFETQTPQILHIVISQVQKMITTDMSAEDAMKAAQKEAEALG